MKILVTGSNGQLGRELQGQLDSRAPGSAVYIDIDTLDLTDRSAVETYMRSGDFSHVINCAAYTDVDKAEEDKMQCSVANVDAVSNLARLADELGFKIIHISTDYVFDGNSCRPYPRNRTNRRPLSVYGVTKRKGETALIGLAPDSMIIRTGWLYSPHGHNFVKTMLELGRRNSQLRVVADQIGTPTLCSRPRQGNNRHITFGALDSGNISLLQRRRGFVV